MLSVRPICHQPPKGVVDFDRANFTCLVVIDGHFFVHALKICRLEKYRMKNWVTVRGSKGEESEGSIRGA